MEEGQRFVFVRYFNVMHFLNVTEICSRSLVFSGLVLLKWFTKSFKFGKGFNDNELFGDDTGNIALNRTAGQPFTAFFMETFCSFKENWALTGHF